MDFYHYQLSQGNALNTARSQASIAEKYADWCEERDVKPEQSTYDTLTDYLNLCKAQGNVIRTLNAKIVALQHYFNYLELPSNPATMLRVKGQIRTLPNNLLDEEDLLKIFELQRTVGLAGKRDKVLLSFVVFQAMRSLEISRLELKNLRLMEGKIDVSGTLSSNERTLELKPVQMLLIQDYLFNVRPQMIAEAGVTTDLLLVSGKCGKALVANAAFRLVKILRRSYPKLKTLEQIRQSNLSLWVKQHGLRKAQYMSGHRYVSSTERYSQDKLDSLRNDVKLFHPF